MGFYAVEDLKPGSGRAENVDFGDISGENQAAFERFLGLERACKDDFGDIFEQKGGDFVAKIDEKLLFARQLKHNICDFDFDFLGRYKLEKEEAEKLKVVFDEYISLMEPTEKAVKEG